MKTNFSAAFPNFADVHDGSCKENPGLTKREFYAALVMQALLIKDGLEWQPSELADNAFAIANAMLVEADAMDY